MRPGVAATAGIECSPLQVGAAGTTLRSAGFRSREAHDGALDKMDRKSLPEENRWS